MNSNKFLIALLAFVFISTPYFSQVSDDEGQEETEEIQEDGEYENLNYRKKKGVMFGANIGMLFANNHPAQFYDGRAPNTIAPYITNTNSNSYLELVEFFGTPEFTLVELPAEPTEMNYKPAINFGLNFRYQKDWYSAWVADFNYSQLQANGVAVFNVLQGGVDILTQFRNVNLPLYGRETRFTLSAGYQATLSEPSAMGLIFEIGPVFTAVKAERNAFVVGNREYNILRPQLINGNQFRNQRQPTVSDFGAYSG